MSYVKQGKGKGRGRGRDTQPSQPTQSATPTPRAQLEPSDFPGLGSTAPAQPRSAWGRPVQTQQQPPPPTSSQSSTPTPTPPPQPQQSTIVSAESSSVTSKSDTRTIVEKIESVSILESSPESKVEGSPPKSLTVRVHNGEFPAKRERGDLGRLIKLRANHYLMRLKKEYTLYQYDVELKRNSKNAAAAAAADKSKDEVKLIKNKRLMREMFKHLVEKILGPNYTNKIVYNFSKNLYSLVKLPFESYATYEITLDGSQFTLQLQPTKNNGVITIDPRKPDDPVTIQVLDLIMTQNFNYSCFNLNRSFFMQNCDHFELGFGLELWKGAYASVRPCEVGLTWNLDSANAAFLTSQHVLDLATNHYECSINDLKNAILKDKSQNMIGCSFIDDYKGREIKTATGGFRKRISGFGPDASHKFNWTRGQSTVQISIKDYLFQQYKINLKYPDLPCINLGKESYLPMELCKTEISHKKSLSERQTADMIRRTAVNAPDRMNYINTWANSSRIDKDPILSQYSIDVNLTMAEIDGRVLDPPDIQYTQQTVVKSNMIANRGQWEHRNFKFANSISIKRWIFLNFSRAYDNNANQFMEKMISIGQIHGMQIAKCLDYRKHERPTDKMVSDIFEQMLKKHQPLELIVCVFGGTTTGYKVVKTLGDLTYGVATQCVEGRNVDKLNDQTISNILLKINTKLGGRNFFLSRQNILFSRYLQDLYQGPVMIFGADVTHPAPDNKMAESLAAVVGSLDKECSFYAARLYAQSTPKGQAYEMIHDLDKMVVSLLQRHFEINKGFPKKIVFFRDGVSEGQFSLVLRHEINKIRLACQTVSSGYKPAITFVVVQKRHHTRLFPVNPKDSNGKAQNVPPGTVVDTKIVTKSMIDFFLCSHVGIQGTSRPCHYYVLHDDNQFSMNQIQILSHYLCHIYSRCPRSVSYPAPAYYAHLAAFRGRDYIRRIPNRPLNQPITSYEIEINQNLRNKMFFC